MTAARRLAVGVVERDDPGGGVEIRRGESGGALRCAVGGGISDAERPARRKIREQLFKQFIQINGIPGRPPKIVWGSVSTEEQDAMANTLGVLSDAGLEVADEALPIISERFGLPVQRRAALPAAPGVIPFAASVPRLKKKPMSWSM